MLATTTATSARPTPTVSTASARVAPGREQQADAEHRADGRGDAPVLADHEVPPEAAERGDVPHRATLLRGRGLRRPGVGAPGPSTRTADHATAHHTARIEAQQREVAAGHSRLVAVAARDAEAGLDGRRSRCRNVASSRASTVSFIVITFGTRRRATSVQRRCRRREHDDAASRAAPSGRHRHVVGVEAERDDDEDDLEAAAQQHALGRSRRTRTSARPATPLTPGARSAATSTCLADTSRPRGAAP